MNNIKRTRKTTLLRTVQNGSGGYQTSFSRTVLGGCKSENGSERFRTVHELFAFLTWDARNGSERFSVLRLYAQERFRTVPGTTLYLLIFHLFEHHLTSFLIVKKRLS